MTNEIIVDSLKRNPRTPIGSVIAGILHDRLDLNLGEIVDDTDPRVKTM